MLYYLQEDLYMEEKLSINEITKVIIKYICGNSQSALMIDGEWGSGKTYFIKEHLTNEIKKLEHVSKINKMRFNRTIHAKKSTVYVSLYGINSLEEITDEIYRRILNESIGKAYYVLPFISEAINQTIKLSKFDIKFKGFRNNSLANNFDDPSRFTIIIDDLERTRLNITDILGYVNQLTEHNGFKVVVVSNEDEIGNLRSLENLEGKYLVSLLANKIDTPIYEAANNIEYLLNKISDEEREKGLITNENELKLKSQLIFKGNLGYERAKEKSIETTLKYVPDLSEIFDSLISDIDDNREYNCIKQAKNTIISIFKINDCYNIRTLRYTIDFLQRVVKNTRFLQEKEHYTLALLAVARSIANVSITYKTGVNQIHWSENGEYKRVNFDKSVGFESLTGVTSFRFVHNYVTSALYDEKHIEKVLMAYIKEELDIPYDPTNVLSNYAAMQDNDVVNSVNELYENLLDGKYSNQSYPWILGMIFHLKSLRFEIDDAKFIDAMTANSLKYPGVRIDSHRDTVIQKDNIYYKQYIDAISKLEEFIEENSYTNVELKMIDILSRKGWPKLLIDDFSEKESFYINEGEYFVYFDINILLNKLEGLSVSDFVDLRRLFQMIYRPSMGNHYYNSDKGNLIKLYSYLKSISYIEKTKDINRKWFIDDLESYFTNIKIDSGVSDS